MPMGLLFVLQDSKHPAIPGFLKALLYLSELYYAWYVSIFPLIAHLFPYFPCSIH